MTAERITCQRCGNANPLDASKCLACGCINPFVASRDLSDEHLIVFISQVRKDFERARRGINAARRAREAADESAASWLWSLNRTKQYALKHGIKLDD